MKDFGRNRLQHAAGVQSLHRDPLALSLVREVHRRASLIDNQSSPNALPTTPRMLVND